MKNHSNETLDLFRQVAAGDEDAFKDLFDLYVPRLHPMIQRITRSSVAADDLVQEAFLKVWIARDQLYDVAQPGAWIMKIGFFLAVNHVRRQVLQQKMMDDIEYGRAGSAPYAAVQQDVDFRQLLLMLNSAVRELPDKQRRIYQLSRERGLTIPEIAQETGLAANTVKNLLVMALKHIRAFLQKEGYSLILAILAIF